MFNNYQTVIKITGIKNEYYQLNEVIVYAYSGKHFLTTLKEFLSIVYILGVMISGVFFVVGMGKIILLIARSKSLKYEGFRIVESKQVVVPFSLFKWIIINPEKYSSDDMKQIIAHEQVHAFQLHSFDLIIIEVLVILFWYNPFIYWYRKSIREVHEYLADRAIVENGFDQLEYQQLLLSQVTDHRFLGLTSSFSYSLSKNRLKMLTMMKSKNMSKTKLLLAIPVALLFVFFFTNTTELAKASIKKNTPPKAGIIKDTIIDGYTIIETNENKDDVIFTCEVMPKFEGKDSKAFRVFIQEHLKYPAEAQKKGVQGRVFVQFDVDVDGSVKNVIVVRGVNPLLDQEAIRVIKSSPKWKPGLDNGEPVRVRYTFPIVFSLQSKK